MPEPQLPPKPPTQLTMGPPGSGKSYASTTYLAAGVETFILLTEPNGIESVMKSITERKLEAKMPLLHWRTISPSPPGWDALSDQADKANTMTVKGLSDLNGIQKNLTRKYSDLLKLFANFVDDTGRAWGDVTEWDGTRALVIDSLTGINDIVMDQTIGYKPVASQAEWQIAMNMQRKLMLKLTSDCRCHLAVLAHTGSEVDETTGSKKTTIDALGAKNAKPISGRFGNIVAARRDGSTYLWSTSDYNTDTKQGNYPLSDKIVPDYGTLVRAHQAALENWKRSQGGSVAPA